MGIDSSLFVSNKWTLSDIKETFERLCGKVKFRPTHDPGYIVMSFKDFSGADRTLSVFSNSEEAGFRGTRLMFRSNPEGVKLLEAVAGRLGGFLNRADTNNDFESYQTTGMGNLAFHLREQIINGTTDGRDIDKFAKTAKKLNERLASR